MGGDAYGGIAKFYDRVIDPINAPLREAAIRLAAPTSSTRALDVGCGTGSFVSAFLDTGAQTTGLDLSEAMLSIARNHIPAGDFHLGDATSMPFEDATFDLTSASLFLHELEPDTRDKVLREMARVTAHDGRLVVIDYRIGSLRFKGRVSRVVSTVAERFAGRDHYRNWRTYMNDGGMPGAVERLGMSIEQTKIAAGGNMGIWLIAP